MGSEMRVIFEDLVAASKTFHSSGVEFSRVASVAQMEVPMVLTEELRDSLSSVVSAINQGHIAIAAAIDLHSTKLRRAHDVYRYAEITSKELARNLENPDAIGAGT
ncbi:DUF6317 family protein [Spirillospora sp. NBC_01491]|uniref:DUF6317 family protein n=1 Tax=Spirillospora sp. NBC_01491 TaxID=2976007 RepID=UPI002E346BAD|nr:DUF6317 family protein [Spirillospora sp. NBC_01491]